MSQGVVAVERIRDDLHTLEREVDPIYARAVIEIVYSA